MLPECRGIECCGSDSEAGDKSLKNCWDFAGANFWQMKTEDADEGCGEDRPGPLRALCSRNYSLHLPLASRLALNAGWWNSHFTPSSGATARNATYSTFGTGLIVSRIVPGAPFGSPFRRAAIAQDPYRPLSIGIVRVGTLLAPGYVSARGRIPRRGEVDAARVMLFAHESAFGVFLLRGARRPFYASRFFSDVYSHDNSLNFLNVATTSNVFDKIGFQPKKHGLRPSSKFDSQLHKRATPRNFPSSFFSNRNAVFTSKPWFPGAKFLSVVSEVTPHTDPNDKPINFAYLKQENCGCEEDQGKMGYPRYLPQDNCQDDNAVYES
ncbi:hypothetical protein B0H16DRAFT_1691894 [Mycena metata]|uniref:Uncharacterized protein n=1 Tax=Mycena metata TaxID=1033252 RepID=A0AAD7ISB8_9AGAR|nr:hypothetical protein B0H16DRAFT_1691894 [Mycena metata]